MTSEAIVVMLMAVAVPLTVVLVLVHVHHGAAKRWTRIITTAGWLAPTVVHHREENLVAMLRHVEAERDAAVRQFPSVRLPEPAHRHNWTPVTASLTGELLARLCPSCGLSEYVAPGDRLTS